MLHLKSDSVSVNYAPIHFHSQDIVVWLPQAAIAYSEFCETSRRGRAHLYGLLAFFGAIKNGADEDELGVADAFSTRDRDSARVISGVFEVDADDRPVDAQREFFSPLHNHDRRLGEEILQAERVEIARAIDAIRDPRDRPARIAPVSVNQSESRARDFFFEGRFPSPLTIPFVRVVLPAPSSPERRIRTGATSCAPSSRPSRMVSSEEFVTISWLSTAEFQMEAPIG